MGTRPVSRRPSHRRPTARAHHPHHAPRPPPTPPRFHRARRARSPALWRRPHQRRRRRRRRRGRSARSAATAPSRHAGCKRSLVDTSRAAATRCAVRWRPSPSRRQRSDQLDPSNFAALGAPPVCASTRRRGRRWRATASPSQRFATRVFQQQSACTADDNVPLLRVHRRVYGQQARSSARRSCGARVPAPMPMLSQARARSERGLSTDVVSTARRLHPAAMAPPPHAARGEAAWRCTRATAYRPRAARGAHARRAARARALSPRSARRQPPQKPKYRGYCYTRHARSVFAPRAATVRCGPRAGPGRRPAVASRFARRSEPSRQASPWTSAPPCACSQSLTRGGAHQ